MTIRKIQDEICDAIKELYFEAARIDYIAFILLIGRFEIQPGLKVYCGTDCVSNYSLDIFHDETRSEFYLNYLRKNYSKDGFCYQDGNAVNDITQELTIFTHLWDSDYYMKSLYRFAAIIAGKGYLWKDVLPTREVHRHFSENVIKPLKDKGLKVGLILERVYKSSLRNAFAHSCYSIDTESRKINIWPNSGYETYTFEDFQQIFLYSVILMNKMENYQEMNHNMAAEKNTAITEAFMTPDGVKVQIYGQMIQRGDLLLPELRIVKVID